jgi:hypothetical protein
MSRAASISLNFDLTLKEPVQKGHKVASKTKMHAREKW